MQRLRVAYNFGCRDLYNLPWRASVSSHQVQCNIPAFEALLRKYTYLFLERCRQSNNVWLRALMQSDFLYSSLFFEHYNCILLCEWVTELCSVRLIDGVSSHNALTFYLDSGTQPGGGAIRQFPPSKFSQTYVFVRRSNKLLHFAPPPENISWLRLCLDSTNLVISALLRSSAGTSVTC